MAAGRHESHWIINVAQQDGFRFDGGPAYSHLFATEVAGTEQRARRVYDIIRGKFPEPLFKVSLTYWAIRGVTVL